MNEFFFGRGADSARNRWASYQTGQAGFLKFLKCKTGLYHCVSLLEIIKKHIWITLFGVRMK
jgi:hypothetical protein